MNKLFGIGNAIIGVVVFGVVVFGVTIYEAASVVPRKAAFMKHIKDMEQ